jgi:hypothetical protein
MFSAGPINTLRFGKPRWRRTQTSGLADVGQTGRAFWTRLGVEGETLQRNQYARLHSACWRQRVISNLLDQQVLDFRFLDQDDHIPLRSTRTLEVHYKQRRIIHQTTLGMPGDRTLIGGDMLAGLHSGKL